MTPSSFIKTVQIVQLTDDKFILMLEDDQDWTERHVFKTKLGAYMFAQAKYSVDKNMIKYYPASGCND